MDQVLRIQDVLWLPPAEAILPKLDRKTRKILEDLLRLPKVLWSGSKSNYLSGKVLGEYFGGAAFSAPANEYFGLWTATLDDTSTGATGSEATYGSYARTQIGTGNNVTDAWNAPTGTTTSTVTNKNAITCPTSTSGSNTLTFCAVCDSGTTGAGNMLVWASISSTVINSGDTPKVNAAGLSVVED